MALRWPIVLRHCITVPNGRNKANFRFHHTFRNRVWGLARKMRFRFSITLHSRLSLCSFYLIEPCLRASILLLTLWKRGKRSRLSTSCCYAQQTKEYLDHENMIREVYKLQQFLTQLDQREIVADRLDEMLGKWVKSIPESYRGDSLPGFGPVQLRYFKQLRVTYYHCIFSILQAALRNK